MTVAVAISVSSCCSIILIVIGVAVQMAPQVSENRKQEILKEALVDACLP